jgi:hypothetical protein
MDEPVTSDSRSKRTPEQLLAHHQLRANRARDAMRKRRTRRLILAGMFFEKAGLLDEWERFDEATRLGFIVQVGRALKSRDHVARAQHEGFAALAPRSES